jgi:hypothetical protein
MRVRRARQGKEGEEGGETREGKKEGEETRVRRRGREREEERRGRDENGEQRRGEEGRDGHLLHDLSHLLLTPVCTTNAINRFQHYTIEKRKVHTHSKTSHLRFVGILLEEL